MVFRKRGSHTRFVSVGGLRGKHDFTFATLKTAIQDYSENTETTFTNNLSNFIKIAEERILKNVQLSVLEKMLQQLLPLVMNFSVSL